MDSSKVNMNLYNAVREVPDSAQKTIKGGRLSGMTDINPMWRIQTLTEQFGPCGDGWKYVIKEKRLEQGADGVVTAFVDIDLSYKTGSGEWSAPIPGTGGSSFVSKERERLYTSDECYKMALTDALGVACKALGVGADIYWAAGRTKYTQKDEDTPQDPPPKKQFQRVEPLGPICDQCGQEIRPVAKDGQIIVDVGAVVERSKAKYGFALCYECARKKAADGGT